MLSWALLFTAEISASISSGAGDQSVGFVPFSSLNLVIFAEQGVPVDLFNWI